MYINTAYESNELSMFKLLIILSDVDPYTLAETRSQRHLPCTYYFLQMRTSREFVRY